jgi:hypothetical protein
LAALTAFGLVGTGAHQAGIIDVFPDDEVKCAHNSSKPCLQTTPLKKTLLLPVMLKPISCPFYPPFFLDVILSILLT